MIYSLIAFGSLFFWVFIALAIALISYCAGPNRRLDHDDQLGYALLWTGITTVFTLAFIEPPPAGAITLERVLIAAGIYVAVGFVYAAVRWKLLLRSIYAVIDKMGDVPVDEKAEGDPWNSNRGDKIAAKVREEFGVFTRRPTAAQFKSLLWVWCALWPFEILFNLARNPFRILTSVFGRIFEGMASSEARRRD